MDCHRRKMQDLNMKERPVSMIAIIADHAKADR